MTGLAALPASEWDYGTITYDLAWQPGNPTGHLAHITWDRRSPYQYGNLAADVQFYLVHNGRLHNHTVLIRAPEESAACALAWHPSGQYLLVGYTTNNNGRPPDANSHGLSRPPPVPTSDNQQLRAYRIKQSAADPTLITDDYDGAAFYEFDDVTDGDMIWGATIPEQLSFSPDGSWLAFGGFAYGGPEWNPASERSKAGLVSFDGGRLTRTYTWPEDDGVTAVWWHPVDDVIARLALTGLSFWRRTGSTLTLITELPHQPGLTFDRLVWHPSGTWFAVVRSDNFYRQDWWAYSWPGLQSIGQIEEIHNSVAAAFDPAGKRIAAGPVTDPPIGPCGYTETPFYGLTVATIARTGSTVTTSRIGRPYVDSDGQDKVAGHRVAWSPDGRYLAAGTYAYGFGQDWGLGGPPSMVVYQFGSSRLKQAQPDGTAATVGVAGRPLTVTLPDGATRTWPGAAEPLYQAQPDGTVQKVIG